MKHFTQYLSLIASVLVSGAVAAPVTLRFQASDYEFTYRSQMSHEEALVGANSKVLLKQLNVSEKLTQRQVETEDGALQVTTVTRPVAAILGGERVSLGGAAGDLDTTESVRMTTEGLRPSANGEWNPELPRQAVEVGDTWTQPVVGPDGHLRTLRCKLASVTTGDRRTIAKILFQSVSSDVNSEAKSKWRVRGKWSLDIEKGVLLSSESETALVAKYSAPVAKGADRFVRKVLRKRKLAGARAMFQAAD